LDEEGDKQEIAGLVKGWQEGWGQRLIGRSNGKAASMKLHERAVHCYQQGLLSYKSTNLNK